MAWPARDLFVSAAFADGDRVQPLLDGLKAGGLGIWSLAVLRPGADFGGEIRHALTSTRGMIVVVSTISSTSPAVIDQIAAGSAASKPMFFIHLDKDIDLAAAREHAWFDATDATGPADLYEMGFAWTGRIMAVLATALAPAPRNYGPELDAAVQSTLLDLRDKRLSDASTVDAPDSIFVVHGHDEALLNEVCDCVRGFGVRPVVLKQQSREGDELSLWEQFNRFGRETRYAVVLLSADDYGTSHLQYDEVQDGRKVGGRSLKYRARQNVILELGFFYGHLSFDSVFVLRKPHRRRHPDFEMPSDLEGILYDIVDEAGAWKGELRKRLEKAQFKIL